MAAYTYTTEFKIEISGNNGSLKDGPASYSANHKMLYDDILPVSADFSLEPFLANLDAPLHLGIMFSDPTGFSLALDGVIANASSNKIQSFFCKFGAPAGGPPPVHITTTVAARLQVFALGDPSP